MVAAREVRKTGKTLISSDLADAMDELLKRLGHLAPDQWPFVLPQASLAPTKSRSSSDSAQADAKAAVDQVQAQLEGNDKLREARDLWHTTLQDVQLQMPQSIFDTWLRDSQVIAAGDDALVIEVRNRYAVDWLQTRLLETVLRPLSRLAGREMCVRFEGRQ